MLNPRCVLQIKYLTAQNLFVWVNSTDITVFTTYFQLKRTFPYIFEQFLTKSITLCIFDLIPKATTEIPYKKPKMSFYLRRLLFRSICIIFCKKQMIFTLYHKYENIIGLMLFIHTGRIMNFYDLPINL